MPASLVVEHMTMPAPIFVEHVMKCGGTFVCNAFMASQGFVPQRNRVTHKTTAKLLAAESPPARLLRLPGQLQALPGGYVPQPRYHTGRGARPLPSASRLGECDDERAGMGSREGVSTRRGL